MRSAPIDLKDSFEEVQEAAANKSDYDRDLTFFIGGAVYFMSAIQQGKGRQVAKQIADFLIKSALGAILKDEDSKETEELQKVLKEMGVIEVEEVKKTK